MPRAQVLKLPKECLKNGFTKEENLLIIKAMLLQINFKVYKSKTLRAKIPYFGTISTHGNKKSVKSKYQKGYNRKLWREQRKKTEFSEKFLLF